ncbi:MAG: protein-methionine-sulfoxide reductase heme-binding subunit MsrQ [Methylobacter sp.]|jgi:sulfoxide reductase heme-binding subunit YedZ|nr:protein-methionine-sulfoxide reductase heme-binding subunit MsrQ [Methylobacter sp.]
MLSRLNTLWSWVIIAGLLPLLWLIINTAFDNLGGNPIQALHIRLGDWSLRFLYLTLAITPLQKVTQWRGMADYRQMLGLYAFFYATLHLLVYLLVDHGLMWRVIGIDIVESSYIWFGILAYSIVFGLALTSSKWAKKRMGKNWKKFHRFIYIAAIAAIIHYFWQLKGNLAEPLFYSLIIFLLLGFRVLVWLKNRKFSQLMIPGSQKVLLAAEKKAVVSSKSNKLNVK